MSSKFRRLRIAVEGCGHGALDPIYSSIQKACEVKGWDGVDLVIIGGDFQAVRTQEDLNVTAMPAKYRKMGDFHKYYDGTKKAPYLTVFIGGNHEASNHLFELYYGGWVAPNIYYLGAANVLRFGPLKIAGVSGIWKGSDYRKPHFERLPYSEGTMRSIYHTRELDVRKLLSYRSQVDIGMSHDWPQGIEWLGDHKALFRAKPYLEDDARSGRLNSVAAREALDWLRPMHWFSAHHHYKFTATKTFAPEALDSEKNSEAIAAWNKFHSNVQDKETSEAEQHFQTNRHRPGQIDQTGNRIVPSYAVKETFKQVQADGVSRKSTKSEANSQHEPVIPQMDGGSFSLPQKRPRGSTSNKESEQKIPDIDDEMSLANSQCDGAVSSLLKVVDPAAIDIDMSDEDLENETTKPASTPDTGNNKPSTSETTKDQQIDMSQTMRPLGATETETPEAHNGVSNEMREKLAAISSTFSATEQSPRGSRLPHPETIWNRQTKFLALSKCEPGKDFLQLMEIEPTHVEPDTKQQPLKLQYDPEWLAILRVFAPELSLGGSSSDRGPVHKGDTYYRDCIHEEEKWVQENVIDKNLLEVPENFEVTTVNQITGNQNSMPREVTNPQTSRFCKLIGIENKFDMSEEDRDKRMASGPPPETRNFRNRTQHGRGGGGRGNSDGRGRGGGRGRGTRGGRSRW